MIADEVERLQHTEKHAEVDPHQKISHFPSLIFHDPKMTSYLKKPTEVKHAEPTTELKKDNKPKSH